MENKKYEKPSAVVEETTVNAVSAYSAAAIKPVVYGGACIVATKFTRNC